MTASLAAREPVARYLATPPLLQHFDRIAQAPGGVARLRELILTLAVQGKLAPQDPADEPASLLLERIRAEKARLVKEGKVRKEKSLVAISDEEKPFELPAEWEWVRLQDLTELITSGSRDWAKYHADHGAIFVGMGNLSRGSYKLRLDRIQYVAPPISGEGTRTRLEAFDLLVSITGEVGMLGLIPANFGEAYINQHTCLIRWLPTLRSKFFPIQLLAPFAQSQFNSPQRGIKNSFRLTDASAMLIALPPLAEQSRIVARVEELMALCDALEEKGRLAAAQHERLAGALFDALASSASAEEAADHWQRIAAHFDLLLDRPAAVDRLEQAILQLAVRGRLVPQNPADEPASALLQKIRAEKDRLIAAGQLKRDKPLPPISDEEKPFELPEGWEWVRLGQIIELISGQHLLPNEYSENLDLEIPYLTGPAEFGPMNPQPTRSTNERRAIATKGDILITVKGSGVGKLNSVGFEELAISRQLMAIRPFITSNDFLFLALSVLGTSFQEKSVGIAIPGISRVDVTDAIVALPPLTEQSRIVARVAELRALCAQLRERLTATDQTRSRLAEALLEQAVA